jgi:hypothetical protein
MTDCAFRIKCAYPKPIQTEVAIGIRMDSPKQTLMAMGEFAAQLAIEIFSSTTIPYLPPSDG